MKTHIYINLVGNTFYSETSLIVMAAERYGIGTVSPLTLLIILSSRIQILCINCQIWKLKLLTQSKMLARVLKMNL